MIIYLLLLSIHLFAITLQEAYDNAQAFAGYDKYIMLVSDILIKNAED